MQDFSPVINRVLIGGLYVYKESEFFSKYISNMYQIEKRDVKWLTHNPTWDYVCDTKQISLIKQYAVKHGITPFDSDTDLIKSYLH